MVGPEFSIQCQQEIHLISSLSGQVVGSCGLAFLGCFSPSLAELVMDVGGSEEVATIIVPASEGTINNLLFFMATGNRDFQTFEDLLDVGRVAMAMGVDTKNWEMVEQGGKDVMVDASVLKNRDVMEDVGVLKNRETTKQNISFGHVAGITPTGNIVNDMSQLDVVVQPVKERRWKCVTCRLGFYTKYGYQCHIKSKLHSTNHQSNIQGVKKEIPRNGRKVNKYERKHEDKIKKSGGELFEDENIDEETDSTTVSGKWQESQKKRFHCNPCRKGFYKHSHFKTHTKSKKHLAMIQQDLGDRVEIKKTKIVQSKKKEI